MKKIVIIAAFVAAGLAAGAQDWSYLLEKEPPSRGKFLEFPTTLRDDHLKGNVSHVHTIHYDDRGDIDWKRMDYYTMSGKRYYSVENCANGDIKRIELCSYDAKDRLVGYYSYKPCSYDAIGRLVDYYSDESTKKVVIKGSFAVAKYDSRGNFTELTYYESANDNGEYWDKINLKLHDKAYVDSIFKNIDHKLIIKFTYHYDADGKLIRIDTEGPSSGTYEADYQMFVYETVTAALYFSDVDSHGNYTTNDSKRVSYRRKIFYR